MNDLTHQLNLLRHRQEAADAAAEAPSVAERPVSEAEVARFGVAKIVSNTGGGDYTITEQWWDPSGAGQWSDATAPLGYVQAPARDYGSCDWGKAGVIVPFWEQRAIGGALELIVNVEPDPHTFGVKVTKDGGSAGNKTTQCSFTYTVKDLAGNTLATAKSPSRPRPLKGAMDPPADNSYGLAFYDGSTLVLWDAGETLDVEACP